MMSIMPAAPEAGAVSPSVPRTAEELAALEARYRPFLGAGAWRGVHVDEPRWSRYAHLLKKRIRDAGPTAWQEIQDRLLRATALDGTALDGLMPANPELTATVLASSIGAADSDPVIELVAECHRRALVLASEAAEAGRPVDVNLIAVLQDVITESQATYTVTTERGVNVEVDLPRRQYKPVSNYMPLPSGGLAVFAPAGRVAEEMDRLTRELASSAFGGLHPAAQAAYAHYALTAIHPFADGNGRLARTIASIFLFRAVGLPLLIFADQWPVYYQAVGYHAQGIAHEPAERQALTDHVAAASIGAMDLASNMLAPRHSRPARRGRKRATPASALDEGARALLETLSVELRELLAAPPRGLRLAVGQARSEPDSHEGAYRVVGDAATGRFGVRVAIRRDHDLPSAATDLQFVALASELPGDLLPVALREIRSGELFEAALSDVYPLVLEPAAVRVRLWAQRLLAEVGAPMPPESLA
jgi:Fic/DOC family protein